MRWGLLVAIAALLLGVAFIIQENGNGDSIHPTDTLRHSSGQRVRLQLHMPLGRKEIQTPTELAPVATPVPTTVPNTPEPVDSERGGGDTRDDASRRVPTMSNRPNLWDEDGIRGIVCSKPWPCEEALTIVDCESKGNTNERSPTGDFGLFGINYENHRDKVFQVTGLEAAESLFDPWVNVEVGYMIYSGVGGPGGWEQWVCTPY